MTYTDDFDIRLEDTDVDPRVASDMELAKAIRATLFHLAILEEEARNRGFRFSVEVN